MQVGQKKNSARRKKIVLRYIYILIFLSKRKQGEKRGKVVLRRKKIVLCHILIFHNSKKKKQGEKLGKK